jgi:transcriptional regulator with XRE-family HTH domain
MKTGEKIAKARKNTNLTQDQLAELLEVTRQTISKWESGLTFPETSKISKLAEVLKVSCDYLLREEKVVTVEVSTPNLNSYAVDWTKLYPVLAEYQSTVDCNQYLSIFTEMIKEMMPTHNYSLDDTVLVLKDLLYKAYLDMQKEEK